jgi:zinc/manganese transport system substrate-binding protein
MMTRNRSMRKPWSLVVVLALLVAACGSSDGETGSGPTVVATTTILGDVAKNVVGDDAEIVVLMPVGADPHDFQASSAQVATINGADLVIANGLFLEEGLEDVLDAARGDGVRVLEVGAQLDPIPFALGEHAEHEEGEHAEHEEGEHAEHEEEGDHEHGSADPHIWFDPIRMGQAARLIAAELAEVAPDTDWAGRADAYAEELTELDEEIVTMLADIPTERRRLVTNHGSLGYFADRYDFEVVGTVIPTGSTLADPSSEELSQLISTMESEQVNVIFADTTLPTELADAVAAELGERVEVVALYTGSLDEPGSSADTLIGMLRANADRVVAALSG